MRDVKTLDGRPVKYLFSDIDDTMTSHGKLPADAFEMIWTLSAAGIGVIPVTGRPAGWCDMIARFWPVRGVIGENGAFYFSYDETQKKMKRQWIFSEEERAKNKNKLAAIENEILTNVPGAAISSDQFSRAFDLTIDFCEDVPRLSDAAIQQIVSIFQKHGAIAKVSSIHVNGWFGNYDKLSMCQEFCKKELGFDLSQNQKAVAFSGDSPNDEPMFAFFENSVGVANIKAFEKSMTHLPHYVCAGEGASGFVELGNALLKNR